MSSREPLATSQGIGRLWLFAAYALLLLTENVMHTEGTVTIAIIVATSALWLAMLVDYVRLLARAEDRARVLRRSLGYPFMLVTLPFATTHEPWAVAIPLVIGFILQLRQVAAGHALTFALGLSAFAAVLATVGVVYAEQSEPQSRLRDWEAAATWSVSILLHLRGYDPGKPLSDDGIALSFVLSVAGFLVAALLTARIVSWVIGEQPNAQNVPVADTERTSS